MAVKIMSFCFLSSRIFFVLSCTPQESLRYPQVSPLTEVFPSVCLLDHLSECLLVFSPQEALPVCFVTPCWLLSLTHASAGVPWAAVPAVLMYVSWCWNWLRLTWSDSWPPPSWVTLQLPTTQTLLFLTNITAIHFTYQNIFINIF